MKLVQVRVRKFRNFIDSSPIAIEPDVTCLVGKNESGKTAFLHALHRLLPAEAGASFDVQPQYPAWIQKRDRQKGVDLEKTSPIEAVFEFEGKEIAQIEERFGSGVLQSRKIRLQRQYSEKLLYFPSGILDESKFIEHVVDQIDWPYGTKSKANEAETIDDLRAYAQDLAEAAKENDEDDEKGKQKKTEYGS